MSRVPGIAGAQRIAPRWGTNGPLSFAVFLGLFLAVSPLGCTRNVRPFPPPEIKKDASLQELLALYDLRYRGLVAIKGLAKVEVSAPSVGNRDFKAAVSLTSPAGFRMEGFDLFGGPLFELVSRSGENHLFVSGKEKSEGLGDLLGGTGPLRPGFSDFLGIPRVVPPELPVLEKGENRFSLLVVRPTPDGPRLVKKFLIERGEFRVEETIYYSESGFPQTVLSFSDFRRVKEFWLPFKIAGKSPLGEARLSFAEIITNPPRVGAEARTDAASGD
jgi:hypothetical protein